MESAGAEKGTQPPDSEKGAEPPHSEKGAEPPRGKKGMDPHERRGAPGHRPRAAQLNTLFRGISPSTWYSLTAKGLRPRAPAPLAQASLA